MPQLTLEYSTNITESADFSALFAQCHHILAELLPAELASCKSRAIAHANFYVGDGKPANAFVSLKIQVLPGRSEEKLEHVGENVLPLLKAHFAESLKKLNLQITLEVANLSTHYFKITR